MQQTAPVRTIGIEEELLLVDRQSGRPLAVSGSVLRQAARRGADVGDDGDDVARPEAGGTLESELQQQQIETDTPPQSRLSELEEQVRAWRRRADEAARAAGAAVVALGTSPVACEPRLVAKPRYERMVERFGLTTSEQLTCGCHVHVAVDSLDEAVGVLDRIRVWLPTLIALSANSPFWHEQDSRYASYRAQAWGRWPTAGPVDVLGSADAYTDLVQRMLGTGVPLDGGMLYFDARASQHYPTVEIRVADVCLDARDAVLVAGLCRALVDTAADEWRGGIAAPDTATSLLRLASWQASRFGLDGDLLDPAGLRPRPAAEVVTALVEHVGPALKANGDDALVEQRVGELLERGTGARRQRRVLERTGSLVDVVADAARVTLDRDG